MTVIEIRQDTLHVRFTNWESLMVRRHGVSVPLTAIERVEVLPGWSSQFLGLRSGLVISGWYKLATFVHPSGIRRLVSMKRGLPLLRIGIADRTAADGFDELLLSTERADQLAAQLSPDPVRPAAAR